MLFIIVCNLTWLLFRSWANGFELHAVICQACEVQNKRWALKKNKKPITPTPLYREHYRENTAEMLENLPQTCSVQIQRLFINILKSVELCCNCKICHEKFNEMLHKMGLFAFSDSMWDNLTVTVWILFPLIQN